MGLSLALGINHVGARPGDNSNSFDLPSYTLLDATVAYQASENFSARLRVENLTNERWFSGAFHSQSIFPGYGSRAVLAVDYQL